MRKDILSKVYWKSRKSWKHTILYSSQLVNEILHLTHNLDDIFHSVTYLEKAGYLVCKTKDESPYINITIKGIELVESGDMKMNQIFNICNSQIGTLTGDVYIEQLLDSALSNHRDEIESIKHEPDEEKKKSSIKDLAKTILKKSGDTTINLATSVMVSYLNQKMGIS